MIFLVGCLDIVVLKFRIYFLISTNQSVATGFSTHIQMQQHPVKTLEGATQYYSYDLEMT